MYLPSAAASPRFSKVCCHFQGKITGDLTLNGDIHGIDDFCHFSLFEQNGLTVTFMNTVYVAFEKEFTAIKLWVTWFLYNYDRARLTELAIRKPHRARYAKLESNYFLKS